MPRCDSCTAYEPWENERGRCHFLPPAQFRDVRNEMWTPFPLVEPGWWCVQHAEKPPAPPLPSPQAAGGRARAAALTPERRTEIAKQAAHARWDGPDPEDDF